MKTITINNTEYNVKYSIRALFIWEQITGKRFDVTTTMDSYLLFYSMILASNKGCTLTFDEFIDAVDEDPSIINNLQGAYLNQSAVEKLTAVQEESKNVESL